MTDTQPDKSLPRATVSPAETPTISGLLALAVGVVVIAALYIGKDVLIPITVAVLLSFVLAPLVNLMGRVGLGRLPSVLITVITALLIVISLAGLIGSQLAQLASEIPRYQTTIQQKVLAVRGFTAEHFSEMIGRFGREVERANAPVDQSAPAQDTAAPEPKPMPVEVHHPPATPIELAKKVLSPIVGPLETAGIIFIVAIFVLMQQDDLRDRLIRLFGSSDLHRTTVAMDDAARRLSRYFLAQLGLNAAFGVVIGLGLWAIGVPNALLWGIIAAVMRFVPYVGAFIAAIAPLTLAAAVDPGWSMVLWTAALFVIAEPLMGHGIEPMMYGRSTGLSPISIIVAAIFWAWLWGPIGLILSTPLTLCLVVLGRHVESLTFIDVLLGDRPALTPAENFYQRVLAGDPDEAQDHAELLLKERSLSSYYDEVALKGLQLAAKDVTRGVLMSPQLDQITDAVRELVKSLSIYEDVDRVPVEAIPDPVAPSGAELSLPKAPAPDEIVPEAHELAPEWQGQEPVLCLAGRGPLDEAASRMLAQLLGKNGLGARVAAFDAASRQSIRQLPVDGIAMVCISYLEIAGNPAHLRYLIQRLRSRIPHARILVGLWPADDAVLRDQALRALVGADDYVISLREGVNACLRAAREASEPTPKPQLQLLRPRS